MSNFSRFASMRKSFERKCILHDNRIEYTDRGAFKTDSSVRFGVKVPVNSETVSMVLRNDETGETVSYDMAEDSGVFAVTLDRSSLSENGGLFFYKYKIHTSNGDFEIADADWSLPTEGSYVGANEAYEGNGALKITREGNAFAVRSQFAQWQKSPSG